MARISHHRGFTLIELIAVLVILGILSAAIMPQMFSLQPFSARGYVDELAAAIQHTQSVAASSGCQAQITIKATGYSAFQRATCTAGAWSTAVPRSDGTALTGSTPSSVPVASSSGASLVLTFNTLGTQGNLSGAALPSLTVGTYTLSVDPVSALVTIQ